MQAPKSRNFYRPDFFQKIDENDVLSQFRTFQNSVFHNLKLKVMKIGNEVNLLKLFFLNYKEQNLK